jgi:hypothetical protein
MIQTIFGSPVVFLKTDNLEELFPKTVYNETIEYLVHPDNKFTDHPLSRGGKICTTSEYFISEQWLNTINTLSVLVDFLKNSALTYAHLYTNCPVRNLKFHSSWVNLTFHGCEINSHNDRSDTDEKSLIVLFYPKAPKGGSNLVFIHNSKEGDWVSDCQEKDLVRTVIDEGDIVIFDNFMFHAVDAHGVDAPRMCVAIEFTIET